MEDAVRAFTGALVEGIWEEPPSKVSKVCSSTRAPHISCGGCPRSYSRVVQLYGRILCALRGCPDGSYLEVVGGNGGQCTHVWPSGEIAFRQGSSPRAAASVCRVLDSFSRRQLLFPSTW